MADIKRAVWLARDRKEDYQEQREQIADGSFFTTGEWGYHGDIHATAMEAAQPYYEMAYLELLEEHFASVGV